MNDIQVTVIVASYCPKWEKLKKTIVSILKQKNIEFEIVITDDGSDVNCFEEVRELMKSFRFDKYKLVAAEKNEGTCRNIYKGLAYAHGKYTKLISPGDCFFDENSLKRWNDFALRSGADVCIADSVDYYLDDGGLLNLVNKVKFPINASIYEEGKYNTKDGIINYICLSDVPYGANFYVDTNLMKMYMDIILDKVVYAEDMMYRIMMCDGKRFAYFMDAVMWYEYGTGISTNQSNKWAAIIQNEKIICNQLILGRGISLSGWNRKRVEYCLKIMTEKPQLDALKYIILPELIYWKILKTKNTKYNNMGIEKNLYYKITNIEEE